MSGWLAAPLAALLVVGGTVASILAVVALLWTLERVFASLPRKWLNTIAKLLWIVLFLVVSGLMWWVAFVFLTGGT